MKAVICPDCHTENLGGEEECVSCSAPLVRLDRGPDRQSKGISRDRIGTLRLSPATTVTQNAPIVKAIEALRDQLDGCVMVVDDGKLVGVVTERDVLYKVAGRDLSTDTRVVHNIMTNDPVCVYTNDRVAVAFNKMAVGGFRHLPVFDGERLAGVITMSTLLLYLHEHHQPAKV